MNAIKLQSHKVLARSKYWRVWLQNNTEASKAARMRYAASPKGKAALAKAKAKYYQKRKKEADKAKEVANAVCN